MTKRLKQKILILIMILFCINFAGCTIKPEEGQQNSRATNSTTDRFRASEPAASKPAEEQVDPNADDATRFDEITDLHFKRIVQSDTLSLHIFLAFPETFGINNETVTMGNYSLESIQEDMAYCENLLSTLHSIQYENLDEEQKLTYDLLVPELESALKLSAQPYFNNIFGPTTGIQVQLPIILAEYTFYSEQDIINYIEILKNLKPYFKQLSDFQKEKAEAGFFMADSTIDKITEQCEQFIVHPQNNILLTCFAENLQDFEGLTQEQADAYIVENRKAVEDSVIPAYQYLIATLKELKGSSVNNGGLCGFEGGNAYYEALLQENTASSKTVKEIKSALTKQLQASLLTLFKIQTDNPSIFDQFSSVTYPCSEPKEIMDYLKDACSKDFPELEEVNFKVNYLPAALQDKLSGAMYLNPPLDFYQDNKIFVNKTSPESELFPTLAHEGYPGHLYQTVFFRNTNPSLIRNVISSLGYNEGWAVYSNVYSYYLAGLEESLADYMAANIIATNCLYSLADIGIHYEGWSREENLKFWSDFGITAEYADDIYLDILSEPCIYPPYAVGYIELIELKDAAQKALGDRFSIKEFHRFFLETGTSTFDVLHSRLEAWVKEQP